MTSEAVINTYQRLWPEADRIRTAAYRFGAARVARQARDYLGLDLLNGGLREVWSLADQLAPTADSLVLELGCGIGGPARHIAERFRCPVVGIDVVDRQLAIARELTVGLASNHWLTFRRADARSVPYGNSHFSHVYANEAFVHFPDKITVLHDAYRVLRPGGTIAIQDPVGGPIEIGFLEQTLDPWPVAGYLDGLASAGFVDVAVVDRTESSRRAYALLGELVSRGPIAPWTVLEIFRRLHGLTPQWWRTLRPERLGHQTRYIVDRRSAALDLLGSEWRVEGIRRMCADIVSAYDRGALRFCLIRATKP